MYNSIFTFKTRRKYMLLLLCTFAIVHGIASQSSYTNCPEPCECHTDNQLQWATCSQIYPNQSDFPYIRGIRLLPPDSQTECRIPSHLTKILPRVQYLNMANCSLSNLRKEDLENFRYLTDVDLSNNAIKKLDSSVFVDNDKLLYVNFKNNPLHITEKSLLVSKSIADIDLTSCNISRLPKNIFSNLTKLQYLTLADNKLKIIDDDTLPKGLKLLNLKSNHIENLPFNDLFKLNHLKRIDLSDNPINCTCALMGYQNWVSGKGTIFVDGIKCAYPLAYAGNQLAQVPQYDICAEGIVHINECNNNDLCTKHIPIEDPNTNDVINDFVRDQVVPVTRMQDYDEMQADEADEGSGDGTEIPILTEAAKPKENQNSSNENTSAVGDDEVITEAPVPVVTSSENPPLVTSSENPPPVTSSENPPPVTSSETPPLVTSSETPPTILSVTPSPATSSENPPPAKETEKTDAPIEITAAPINETIQSSTETVTQGSEPNNVTGYVDEISLKGNLQDTKETEKVPSATDPTVITDVKNPTNETVDNRTVKSHENASISAHSLQSDQSAFNIGYIIPIVAILVVIIICLGVYLGQRSSHKKNWQSQNPNDNTELQDVLLDKTKTPIVKNTKYPSEGNSEQTERLMNDTQAPIENGKTHDTETIPNGSNNEEIKRVTAKMSSTSIPQKPIMPN